MLWKNLSRNTFFYLLNKKMFFLEAGHISFSNSKASRHTKQEKVQLECTKDHLNQVSAGFDKVAEKNNLSCLHKVCKNIDEKERKFVRSSIVTPTFTQEDIKNFTTAVSLHVGKDYLSWCQVKLKESECCILDWNYKKFTDLPLNPNPIEVVKMVMEMVKPVPHSNTFILEKDSSKPISKITSIYLKNTVRQSQIISAVISLLCNSQGQEEKQYSNSKFYMIHSNVPAKLFGLLIGNEMVSSDNIVLSLLQKDYSCLSHITELHIDKKIEENYIISDIIGKQGMNMSLLLALAFLELAVLAKKKTR